MSAENTAPSNSRLLERLQAASASSLGKAFTTILDQGVVSATNFFASIILGKTCAKAEFGLYFLCLTIGVLAMNTQNALITSAYVVFSPKMSADERRLYAGSTLFHALVLAGLFVGALACAAMAFHDNPRTPGLGRVLFALSPAIAGILLKEYARQVCFAGLNTITAFLLDAGVLILQTTGFLSLALLGWLSADRALLTTGGATLLAALIWLAFRRRAFTVRIPIVIPDFRRNWVYSRWIFAMNLAFIASNQVYPWLLYAFHGEAANGVFGACSAVVFFANPFILGLGNFLGPKAVHAYAAGGVTHMRGVVNKATLFFAVTMSLFTVLMFIAGDWVIVVLFDASYAGNVMTIGILTLGQLIWALTIPANYALNALERPDVAFKSLLLALVFTFTAGLWLVFAFGPAGVAGGLLAGNVIACVYNRVVYARQAGLAAARECADVPKKENRGEWQ